jgi:anti-sigma regulatory factor (Ser/Thr protein kinase)
MPAIDASPSSGETARTVNGADGGFGMLAELLLPADAAGPGAARIVVAHCLRGLVAGRILRDAELLVSELVTNSLEHAALRYDDPLVVRVYLGAEAFRLEVENPGTVGAIAARHPDRPSSSGGFGLALLDVLAARWGVRRTHSTSVWFEMARV